MSGRDDKMENNCIYFKGKTEDKAGSNQQNIWDDEYELEIYRKASMGGIFCAKMDEELSIIYGNDIFYRMFELEADDMNIDTIGKCRDYIHPEDWVRVREKLQQAYEEDLPGAEWGMRAVTGKGNIRWFYVSAAFEHKEETVINVFIVDDTQRHKRAEEKARKEKWYQIALNQTSANVWEYDLKHHCILLNDGSERKHGYTGKVENVPESLISSGYIHPDSWDDFRNLFSELYAGKERVQADIKTRTLDGTGWWWERVTYTLEYDDDGTPCRAVAVGEDITREKENEFKYQMEARRRLKLAFEVEYREQLFDALAHNADDIYLLMGLKDQEFLQYVSPNLERVLGLSSEQLEKDLGCLADCIVNKTDALEWRREFKKKGKEQCRRLDCFKNAEDGRLLWMETQIRELNRNGTSALLLILKDRTEAINYEQRLSEALVAAECASRAKSVFLSNVSHDIRTPMNAVIGMTEIAEQHLEDTEKVKECLKKITLSSSHLMGLINDVLDMSKIENGKMTLNNEEMNLEDMMENVMAVIRPCIENKEQTFLAVSKGIDHEIYFCDALRVRQIILNILSNACKFTPFGGEINVEVEEKYQKDGTVRLEFVFRDSGMGMNEEFLPHIFEPFIREKDGRVDKIQGSGLGLALTKHIIDMMGGTIEVKSHPGEGTVIFLSIPMIPVEKEEDSHVRQQAQEMDYNFSGKRFLLVEDNELNREIAIELLTPMGAKIDYACNGRQGVDIFERSPVDYYDLILMDIQMPVMNGYKAAEKIRGLPRPDAKEVPIYAMTADAFAEDIEKAKSAGMNGHFAKPLDIIMISDELTAMFVRRDYSENSYVG